VHRNVPSLPKPEIGPIPIYPETDLTKKINQMVKEGTEILEKLFPVESPSRR